MISDNIAKFMALIAHNKVRRHLGAGCPSVPADTATVLEPSSDRQCPHFRHRFGSPVPTESKGGHETMRRPKSTDRRTVRCNFRSPAGTDRPVGAKQMEKLRFDADSFNRPRPCGPLRRGSAATSYRGSGAPRPFRGKTSWRRHPVSLAPLDSLVLSDPDCGVDQGVGTRSSGRCGEPAGRGFKDMRSRLPLWLTPVLPCSSPRPTFRVSFPPRVPARRVNLSPTNLRKDVSLLLRPAVNQISRPRMRPGWPSAYRGQCAPNSSPCDPAGKCCPNSTPEGMWVSGPVQR